MLDDTGLSVQLHYARRMDCKTVTFSYDPLLCAFPLGDGIYRGW